MISTKLSKYIPLLSIVLCLSVAMGARPALASGENEARLTGAQICQPMNLDIALKGLQWRSEGSLNNSNQNLWVVCPIPKDSFNFTMDVTARVVNFSNSTQSIQCLFKVTDRLGNTVRSRSVTETLPANFTGGAQVLGLSVGNLEALSVSCNLPPQTGLLNFLHFSY
jgi:hypothetical protein